MPLNLDVSNVKVQEEAHRQMLREKKEIVAEAQEKGSK